MDHKLIFILVPTAKVKKKYSSCTSTNPTCLPPWHTQQ